jgi:DUF4097 and DUF4098 domain-containing protein YvlB
MRKTIFLLAAASVLLGGSAACRINLGFDYDDYRYRFQDSFAADLEVAETVAIRIEKGPIQISTWDQDRVEIEVVERIKARNEEKAKELADEVKLVGALSGSIFRIEVDFGSQEILRDNYYSELTVTLPKRLALDLKSTHGGISIPLMDSWIEASTTHGSIKLQGCNGNAVLRTSHGRITAGPVGGKLDASTTHGSIEIQGAKGEIRAETSHADISISGPESDVYATTSHAGIELKVPADYGFNVRASTTHGNISDNLPDELFVRQYSDERNRLKGRYRDGDHTVELDTTHASINIKIE